MALEHVHEIGHVHVVVKTPISVNTTQLTGAALERALAERLRGLLAGVKWLEDWQIEIEPMDDRRGFDIKATLPFLTGSKVELWVECQANPRPSQFPNIPAKDRALPQGKRPSHVWVFAAPYISPRMAQLCQEHGWSWFDLSGNCYLNVPNVFQLERTGQEPVHTPPKPAANLSTPEAARVIRALLAPQNAGLRWTQHHMGQHFGQLSEPIPEPSIGLVNKVVRHLREEAFVEELPDGGFKLRDPLGLLAAWRKAYRFDRHQRRNYFTLLPRRELAGRLYSLELVPKGHVAYAAFSAADFQAPHVRQPKTWLYVSADLEEDFRKTTEAKTVDSGENLVVIIPDDEGVFYPSDDDGFIDEQRLACTNPVQTYVDLCHCGGRGEEAAEALLEQNLKRTWKEQRLL